MRERVVGLQKQSGDMKIGDVTIAQAYGGMRSVKCMVWETSALDPIEGIRFRGFTIPELQEKLPKAPGGEEPLPEGIFYLLLTGDLPTAADVAEITEEWKKRSALPDYLIDILKSLPKDMHPMTQFSAGHPGPPEGFHLRRALPEGHEQDGVLGSHVRGRHGPPGQAARSSPPTSTGAPTRATSTSPPIRSSTGAANMAHMLGIDEDEPSMDLMRLYLVIHSDHEGGNVSAHTCHLVGSALSDAYY